MSKKFTGIIIAALIAGGGTLSIPAIVEAANPTQQVTVQSFSVAKSKHSLGNFKKGDEYCSIKVQHKKTNIAAPIPAPVEACNVLTKGQQLTIKASELTKGLSKKTVEAIQK